MKALTYQVQYEADPAVTIEIVVKPRHLIRHRRETRAAEKAGNEIDIVEEGYRIAWIAAETDLPFDEWMDIVFNLWSDADDPGEASGQGVVDPQGGDEQVPTSSPSLD